MTLSARTVEIPRSIFAHPKIGKAPMIVAGALWTLGARREPISAAAVAEMLSWSRRRVQRQIDELVVEGLVELGEAVEGDTYRLTAVVG